MNKSKIGRALISVSDKSGVVDFAKGLVDLGVEIVSTGGTFQTLKEAGLPVTYISEVTNFPEIMDGRVKTLHPAIHGGILAVRANKDHQNALEEQGIKPIDLVAVNLYPFREVAKNTESTWDELIENIDIGGPSMVRSAAKNHKDVIILVNPSDYQPILKALQDQGDVSQEGRIKLALKAYQHTAEYDTCIQETLAKCSQDTYFPEVMMPVMDKVAVLRYGENPGQKAALYQDSAATGFTQAQQLHGKELSYNNWLDGDSAFRLVQEFSEPTAVIIKHTNPCGVACGEKLEDAFVKALASDPVSAYGGIVAVNRTLDEATANAMKNVFWEVIIAPGYTAEAFAILSKKANLRLLELSAEAWTKRTSLEIRSIDGGWLVQDRDQQPLIPQKWQQVTEKAPTKQEQDDMEIAWKVVKHVKSNAIVLVKNGATIGVGAGQMNRVGSAKIALEQAGDSAKGAVLASDAFFPFGDTVEVAAKQGVTAIIQTGGSVRDQESIDKANEYKISMLFTQVRHFKH